MKFIIYNKILILISLLLPVFFCHYDEVIIIWTRDFHENNNLDIYPALELFDRFIRIAAHGVTLIIFSMLLYILGKNRNRKLSDAGKVLFFSLITSGIIAQMLKHLIGRERPWSTNILVLIGPSLKKGYDSFPSGHTTLAFCFAFILSQKFPKHKTLLYSFAVIVGFQRFEAIEHFPSDILAGIIIGITVAKLISEKLSNGDKLSVCQK